MSDQPTYKIALEHLTVPGSGVRAHSKGDHVPADTAEDLARIELAGWAYLVADSNTNEQTGIPPADDTDF